MVSREWTGERYVSNPGFPGTAPENTTPRRHRAGASAPQNTRRSTTRGAAPGRSPRYVLPLDDPEAEEPTIAGGKAAALARASASGLATLPGVVLTTAFAAAVDAGASVADHPGVREAFNRVGGSDRALVVRSSSTVEDTRSSSMAGQFESVVGVRGFDTFVGAVQLVLDSRARAGAPDANFAVLVQPFIDPAFGGVLFGVDPVSGRTDRRVVSAIEGGPSPLVSGEVDGSRYVLDDRAKVLEFSANDGSRIRGSDLRRLVALSDRVASVFGGPQDVEWAITTDRQLWLLQSRFVTTELRGVPTGPIYGPGPVAETFPEPLTELEQDLWVPPLEEAVRAAVLLAGTAGRAEVAASDVVISVAGHVAIDLRLAGEVWPASSALTFINPAPKVRRVRAAWRVGRLRAALPRLAEILLDRVDADLEGVPALDQLTNRQLIALLHRSRLVLRALHAHEILIGMLTDTGHNRMTGASIALRILDEARREGISDGDIVRRSPAVLALCAPRIGPDVSLPAEVTSIPLGTDHDSANDNGILREALRIRVRWLQELSGRAAWLIGERLVGSAAIADPETIRHMSLAGLEAVVTQRAPVPARLRCHEHNFGAPLPARFQLSDMGKTIPVNRGNEVAGGTGAGGGTGRGQVTYDAEDPPPGSVLVTTTLRPGLGPLLPRLNGMVAETGSVLSHLAILAREAEVATVVGYAGAADDLPEGSMVTVDGDSGHVSVEGLEDS